MAVDIGRDVFTRRLPGLESLRALGAGMVLVHHAASLVGLSGISGRMAAVSDAGVAIFFVLSGFLIYRPFAAAHCDGVTPVRTRAFLLRRAAGILPAYWLALTALWATGLVQLGEGPWRYYLLLQVYDATTTLQGIVPAWSLSTEFAFYLFVPFWSLVLRRLAPSRHVSLRRELAGVLLLATAGYMLRALVDRNDRVWAAFPGHAPVYMREVSFSWFPMNCDLFAVGMAVAVVWVAVVDRPTLRCRVDQVASSAVCWWLLASTAFIVFALVAGPPTQFGGYRGWYWQMRQLAFSFIGLCLLVPIVFGDQDRSLLLRAARSPAVVIAGVVSYGFYLWHLDLLEQVPHVLGRDPKAVPFVVAITLGGLLGVAAGYGSWRFFERPVQRRLRRLLD